MTMKIAGSSTVNDPLFEPCNKVTFVPNADGPTRDEFIKQRYGVDPDDVIAVPFSELEGTVLTQVDSNFTYQGSPVSMDVTGDVQTLRVEPEPVTKLGEQLATELDSFDSPTAADISTPSSTYIVGAYESGEPAKMVIDSEEKMEQLEKKATA
jgi:hypothetical protein